MFPRRAIHPGNSPAPRLPFTLVSRQAGPLPSLTTRIFGRDQEVTALCAEAAPPLLERLWPNGMVEEATLVQTVSMLRNVIGCSRGDGIRYIATIPGRGY